MYVKNSIKFKRRQDSKNPLIEIIVIEVFIKSAKSILLACYYWTLEGLKYLPSTFTNYND